MCVRDGFWDKSHEDGVIALYVGILVLNGLILALSWSAFSRIFESISDGEFCSYLMEGNLLNGYIFYVEYLNLTQIISLICTSVAILSFITSILSENADRVFFGIMITVSAYSIRTGYSAITVMNDLIWQKGIFDSHTKETRKKVVSIRRDGTP